MFLVDVLLTTSVFGLIFMIVGAHARFEVGAGWRLEIRIGTGTEAVLWVYLQDKDACVAVAW